MNQSLPKTIGIVGAGTMGSGIAYVAARAECEVILHDISAEVLKRALERIRHVTGVAIKKEAAEQPHFAEILSRIHPRTHFDDLATCEVVIEAAIEDLATKKGIFSRLSDLCGAAAVLASNTSSLSITSIAASAKNPERVAGMHFFNPPHLMNLVEVVKGHKTSDETVGTVKELAKIFGKTPVVTKDTPGFIVNRIARPFYGEALRLLGEGVSTVEEIDRIVRKGGGFKMGPFELMDLIGIDVNYEVTKSIYEQTFHEPRYRPHPIQRQMVESGLLGRKTGRGFYSYEAKSTK
jgi:3-hydroxybutyryl-CoA dehydrogenase